MVEGGLWRRWVFFYIPLSLFVFVLLFPFYWMIVTTFRPDGELYKPWNAVASQPFWSNSPALEPIYYLFEETMFSRWMLNTLFIAAVSTVISLICGVFAGYALARLNFPWAGSLGTTIFVTYLVPQTLLFIPLADIIRKFGLGDTPWALILVNTTFVLPFVVVIMRQTFLDLPVELEEAARVDGASRYRMFWQIILPNAMPALTALAIFSFQGSWNAFLEPLIFISNQALFTLPLGLAYFQKANYTEWPILMAMAVITTVPMAIFYLIFQRWFVEGQVSSGIKG